LLDSGGHGEEFSALGKSLKAELKTTRARVVDLQRTIKIVEQNRAGFKDIDDAELASRVTFCRDMDAGLKTIEDHVSNPPMAKRAPKVRDQLLAESKREEISPVVKDRQMQLQAEHAKQDEVASEMALAVGRLKDIAVIANEELKDQNESLKDLDSAMDHTKHNMDVVMAKLNTLLGSSNNGKLCCIGFLVFLCVLLFLLIVYT